MTDDPRERLRERALSYLAGLLDWQHGREELLPEADRLVDAILSALAEQENALRADMQRRSSVDHATANAEVARLRAEVERLSALPRLTEEEAEAAIVAMDALTSVFGPPSEALRSARGKLQADAVLPDRITEESLIRRALEHAVTHCVCRPSGQTCDRCSPASLALMLLETGDDPRGRAAVRDVLEAALSDPQESATDSRPTDTHTTGE